MAQKVSVLVADDDAAVCQALADLLADEPTLDLVGVVRTADEAIEAAASRQPDVAVLDVRMPGGGGPRAAREIALRSPLTRVIALSAYEEKASVFEMLVLGASGYLVKGASEHEIVEAIHRAVRSQLSISAELATACFKELMRNAGDRKLTEAILRKSDERFRALLESAPDAKVVINRDGLIEEANTRAERLLGYRRDDLQGREARSLLAERLSGDLVEPIVGPDPSMRAGEPAPQALQLAINRKDGKEVPVEVTLNRLDAEEGLTVATIRDVSERNRAEEIERKSAERFRALLESAPDAMVIVDVTGSIQLVNARTEELFGFGRDDLLGQPVERLLPKRFHRAHVGQRTKFIGHAKRRPMGVGLELAGLRKDGTEFPVDISLSPITTDEGMWVVAAIRDITDRNRAE